MSGRRGQYGIDAPVVPAVFGAITAVAAVVTLVLIANGDPWWWIVGLIFVWFGLQTASFLYTTLRGKFAVWDDLLDGLSLRGDERCVDVGCGRGAVLVAVARRLPAGHVTGIDLWRTVDQSGNSLDVAQHNVRSENVADRVALETADMTNLPLADDSADLVVSALAIHNVKSASSRAIAVREAFRVLRAGGRLVIADIQSANEYEASCAASGPSTSSVAVWAGGTGTAGRGWRPAWSPPASPEAGVHQDPTFSGL